MSDATDNRFYREPAAPATDGGLRERIFHIVLTAQHAEQNHGNTVTIAEWARDQIMPELERQAAEVARLTRERDEAQRAVEQELKNRDEAVEWADELALAIAPVEMIGEHTSSNEPWRNALEIAESRPAISADAEVRPGAVDHIRPVKASALRAEVEVSVRASDGTTRAYVREWGIKGGCRQVGLILTDEKRAELVARLSAPVSGSDTTGDGPNSWHVGDDPGADRALLLDAAEYVINGRHASLGALQRNIRVSFAKAGQLLDLLETWGVVGPADGSKARSVLVLKEDLHGLVEAIRGGQ